MFAQEGNYFDKFAFVVTHVDVSDDLEDPEEEYPNQLKIEVTKFQNLISDFFSSEMPKVWAISMQKFKEFANPRSAMALAS